MRVLTRPNVGGPMRQAIALWHALRSRGWRTLLVVGVCEPGEASFDVDASGIPRVTADAVARIGVAAEGIVQIETLRRGVHPLRDRRARAEIARLAAAFRPDVTHTHTTKAGWIGRAVRGDMVTAHTFHGHVLRDYYPRLVSAWLAARERRLAARTDLLFAVSASCRDELEALRVAPPGRIVVVPPAVDVARYLGASRDVARAAIGVDTATLVVGFVGRLVAVKRPELFRATIDRLPNALGVVLGDGPLHAALDHPRIRRFGAVDDPWTFVPGFDVLLLPSRREGLPLAAVEALAAGVPVVGFDVPGVRDVLGDARLGRCVAETDGVAGLAAATVALRDDARAREVARVAGPAFAARFDPDGVASVLDDACRAALRRARSLRE